MKSTEEAPAEAQIARARSAVGAALAASHLVDLTWLGDLRKTGPWRLADDALRLVGSLVDHLTPRQVIEFGSGLSTRFLLGETGRLAPRCRIVSVDHDPDHAYSGPGDDRLTLIIAPIVARQFCDLFLPAYRLDPAALAPHLAADMVIVDAPPAVLGGREGALYQAISLSRPGTVILLDDARRDQEKAALRRVEETLGDKVEILRPEGFRNGLAILIVHEPIAIVDLCKARLATVRRHIRSAVDPSRPIAIVGDRLWRSEIAPGYETLPFLGLDFDWWDSPADDAQAMAALARLQGAGVRYLAITWPDFWWAGIYPGFFDLLNASSREVVRSAALWLFELKAKGEFIDEGRLL